MLLSIIKTAWLSPAGGDETFVSNFLFIWVTVLITGVVLSVGSGLTRSLLYNSHRPFFLEGHKLEGAWTLGPILLILVLALPTLVHNIAWTPSLTSSSFGFASLVAVGHQWYWEFVHGGTLIVDSYTTTSGIGRLFSVDSHFLWPGWVPIRLVISSSDVIHNFNLPIFCLRVDAVPGRAHTKSLTVNRVGLFLGLCSEVCGPGHYSMSCIVEVVSPRSWQAIMLT